MVDNETIKATADATKAAAETSGKALDLVGAVGGILKGPVEELVGILHDKIAFRRYKGRIDLVEKAQRYMQERGLAAPTRELPLKFAVPLFQNAVHEEDADLQEMWARLLVNSGDSTVDVEPRAAFVTILATMTELDASNFNLLAETAGNYTGESTQPALSTWQLPHSTTIYEDVKAEYPPVPGDIAVSIGNLDRLGIIHAASSTFGGTQVFQYVIVTPLGRAFYRACSRISPSS